MHTVGVWKKTVLKSLKPLAKRKGGNLDKLPTYTGVCVTATPLNCCDSHVCGVHTHSIAAAAAAASASRIFYTEFAFDNDHQ